MLEKEKNQEATLYKENKKRNRTSAEIALEYYYRVNNIVMSGQFAKTDTTLRKFQIISYVIGSLMTIALLSVLFVPVKFFEIFFMSCFVVFVIFVISLGVYLHIKMNKK